VMRLLLYGAFLAYLLCLALPFLLRRVQLGIFHPIIFYIIWVGVRGLVNGQAVLPATGLEYHRALTGVIEGDLNLLVAKSFLLDAIAVLSLYLGYMVGPRLRMPVFMIPKPQGLALKTAIWVGISTLGLVALVAIGDGLAQVLMQRGIASDQRIAAHVGGQWNYLAGIGVVAPIVWLAFQPSAIRRPVFWALLLAALLLKFVSTGSRGGTVLPLIMLGAIWTLHYKIVPYRAIVFGLLLALILIGGLGQLRAATQRAATFEQVAVESNPIEWIRAAMDDLQRRSGEDSGQLAILARVPDQVPYLYGESYLSIPFIFVPSAVWGDKPDAGGKLNAIRIYEQPLTAIPPGPVGEAYWNFSFGGVVFVFALYGTLLRLLAALYRANSAHPGVTVFFVFALFYMQPHTPSIYNFLHNVVPAAVIFVSFVMRIDGRIILKMAPGPFRPEM
ncbi:MAG: oligosaccharide repeat unit polymerase, partial [Gammaproteobacteria bacterium]|nr:oligosaccharide repeat unit polymerase [Gammaproteobacteria bacterium]